MNSTFTGGSKHRKLARLWGIEPYRVDVLPLGHTFEILVDGRPPSPDQLRTLAEDVRRNVRVRQQAMN
jgi:hypothetical protein